MEAVMSADMEIWNAGASHASVMRRAIVFRIWFSFTTSTSPLGARVPADGVALTAPVAEARSTSSATMRPSGPVPRRAESSIPRSRAIRALDALLGLGRPFGRFLAAPLALFLPFGRGRAFLVPLVLGDFGRVLGLALGEVFALFADDRDRLADLDLVPLAREDLEKDAGNLGLDLLCHLLGVELVERLALLHVLTLGLEPAHDRAGLHPLAEARKGDLGAHSLPTVFLIAASTSLTWGTTHSSMAGANGIGVNLAPTRAIGASR
jgi:hypothetical protein